MKFGYLLQISCFSPHNEINLGGKNRTALFQTNNGENLSFFNTLLRIFAQMYAPRPPGLIGLRAMFDNHYDGDITESMGDLR